jgi:hypothetical protein
MKILHILRSKPDDVVKKLMEEVSRREQSKEVPLYEGDVDYDRLVKEIFESDQVISWW